MKKKYPFEIQLALLAFFPSLFILLFLLWVMIYAEISVWLVLLTGLIATIAIVYTTQRIYHKLGYQFRSLNNLLDALAQGDYSLRIRTNYSHGDMYGLIVSINGLAQRLKQQRWESVESQLLVRTIIEHIDVAIVALDEESRISFFNPAAERLLLLGQPDADAKLLEQLAFMQSISGGYHQLIELSLGYQQGRFNIHVEEFREAGIQHKLLFITDVRTLLRSEERKAWQRLVRVISHEINNSLSPIASISQTLNQMISRQNGGADANQDLIEGLAIISERANGLRQFVDSYKQLARLPEPQKHQVLLIGLLEKTAILFKSQSIQIVSQADVSLLIDPVQFEQVLINLFKNSIEAMSQVNPEGVIRVEWQVTKPFFKLLIYDQGSGISNTDNLFVPFYSTKKNGSGIGLVLCRQIIEAHNGRLSIANRTDAPGCCVTIELPCIDEAKASIQIKHDSTAMNP